jgi:multidrug resistance efflux pump
LQRYLQLSKSDAVVSNVIDERRQQFEATKARRIAAEGELKQSEARVLLEDAHVERANLELEEAKLCLTEQKSFSDGTR